MRWYWILLIIFCISIILRARIKKRGYLIKDRLGKPVKTKEFLTRWKQGIEGITPLQSTKTSIMGNWITLTGVIAGMIVNALVRIGNQWWWIEIILLGSFILIGIQMISLLQKYWKLKKTEEVMKQLNQTKNKNGKKV